MDEIDNTFWTASSCGIGCEQFSIIRDSGWFVLCRNGSGILTLDESQAARIIDSDSPAVCREIYAEAIHNLALR